MFSPVPKQVSVTFSAGTSWDSGLYEQAIHPNTQMFATAIDKVSIPHTVQH